MRSKGSAHPPANARMGGGGVSYAGGAPPTRHNEAQGGAWGGGSRGATPRNAPKRGAPAGGVGACMYKPLMEGARVLSCRT